MECSKCESQMKHEVRDLKFTYKRRTITIPGVSGHWCDKCREIYIDHQDGQRVSLAKIDFIKQVNACAVSPEFILNIRKKLDIDQREAAEIFGGGINAFSRYENGKAKPPVALVKLLKILDQHPELLKEVRA